MGTHPSTCKICNTGFTWFSGDTHYSGICPDCRKSNVKPKSINIKKYYYKTAGADSAICQELCKIKKTTGIGSITCQECEFNISSNNKEHWIQCSLIDDATAKDEEE